MGWGWSGADRWLPVCAGSTTTSTSPASSCSSCSPRTTTSVQVGQHFDDIESIIASDFLVTYTCDLRPSPAEQGAIRGWVEGGGRWLALHGTNCALDPPAGPAGGCTPLPARFRCGPTRSAASSCPTPRSSPTRSSVHRAPETIRSSPASTRSSPRRAVPDGAPRRRHPVLETRWTGTTRGFVDADWPDDEPRLVLYRRPLGDGEVVYCTLGHCRSHWDMIHPPHNGAAGRRSNGGPGRSPSSSRSSGARIALGQECDPTGTRRAVELSPMDRSNFKPPSSVLLGFESLGMIERGLFSVAGHQFAPRCANQDRAVLVLPGFTASDRSTRTCDASYAARATRSTAGGSAERRRPPARDRRAGAPPHRALRAVRRAGQPGRVEPRRHLRARDGQGVPDQVRLVITLGSPYRFRTGDRGRTSELYDAVARARAIPWPPRRRGGAAAARRTGDVDLLAAGRDRALAGLHRAGRAQSTRTSR